MGVLATRGSVQEDALAADAKRGEEVFSTACRRTGKMFPRSRLRGGSASAGPPGKKIPDQHNEDHKGKEQQSDIPSCPYGGVMHDEFLLVQLLEQGAYLSRLCGAQSTFMTRDSTNSQDMVGPLPGVGEQLQGKLFRHRHGTVGSV